MNKIRIANGISNIEIDDSIECVYDKLEESVSTLKIKVKKDTDLFLDLSEERLDVFINILDDISVSIDEYLSGTYLKNQFKYYIGTNSNLNIKRINCVDEIKEYDIFNLNGECGSLNRTIKTISGSNQKYDMLIYHNADQTKSNITNNGVNIDQGQLVFNVSSFVPKNIINCDVNQNNRIINLTDNICQINPNMYIDCYDVKANHSAFIGGFNKEEIFYLQSRGIKEHDATKLLIHGFLLNGLSNKQREFYNDIIDKYWR